jgi:hypothetical protein
MNGIQNKPYRRFGDATEHPVSVFRPDPMRFSSTTQGFHTPVTIPRRVTGSFTGYKRIFDIVFYYESPSTATDSFALYTYGQNSTIVWIAGAAVTLTATGFTYESTPMRWELDTPITATTYVYVEVDREAGTAKLLKNTTGFTAGTENKETFPLYYIPWDDTPSGTANDHIDTGNVIDMRGTFHWVAGA